MAASMNTNYDIHSMLKPQLRACLLARGMTVVDYKVHQLRELALKAIDLKLPIITTPDDTSEFLSFRTNIVIDGEKISFPVVFSDDLKNWSNDLSSVPAINYPEIFLYLLGCCKWSRERLNAYKVERGYRRYTSNHIHSVETHKLSHDHLYVRANFIRETSQSAIPYVTWCLLNGSGTFISAGCDCTADDGSCKHVVALLFSLVCWSDRHIDRNTASCTDSKCVWENPRKESNPQKWDDIVFSDSLKVQPIEKNYDPCVKNVDTENFCVENLLYNLVKGSDVQINEILENEDVPEGPKTLSDLAAEFNNQGHFISFLKAYFDQEKCQEIEVLAEGQSDNPVWYHHRKGRLTASLIPLAYNYKGNDENNYIVKQVFGDSNVSSAAIEYGKERESLARNLYEAEYSAKHKDAKITVPGLIINESVPHLGASPDCIIHCKCCGKGVVEIKCPYKFRNLSIDELCKEKYFVDNDDSGDFRLREKSNWYLQIQSQMAIANAGWCDFVLYLEGTVQTGKHTIHTQRLNFDRNLWSNILMKVDVFYEKFVLPKLLHLQS